MIFIHAACWNEISKRFCAIRNPWVDELTSISPGDIVLFSVHVCWDLCAIRNPWIDESGLEGVEYRFLEIKAFFWFVRVGLQVVVGGDLGLAANTLLVMERGPHLPRQCADSFLAIAKSFGSETLVI